MRVINAEKKIISYLKSIDASDSLGIGVIIGQYANGKYHIVHIARTSILPPLKLSDISDLNDLWLLDHAKQAAKMLPGGMNILGIFIVSNNDSILDNSFPPQLKSVLKQISKILPGEHLSGNGESNEKIVLNYCAKTEKIQCKLFDDLTSRIAPADLKVIDHDLQWIKLKCKYKLEGNRYFENTGVDLKEQMDIILKDTSKTLKSSLFLFDGEHKNDNDTLDTTERKKKNLKSFVGGISHKNKDVCVTILQNANDGESKIDMITSNKQISVIGQITSEVWLNQAKTYTQATDSIIQDIMRSFSTRLEMHWDSLLEEENTEDMSGIHEFPRRVLINIPDSDVKISDYLFAGEGVEEVKNSVEEILDIRLRGSVSEIEDVEGSMETKKSRSISSIVENDGSNVTEGSDHSRMLFIGGSIFAFIVLLISIIIHFIMYQT